MSHRPLRRADSLPSKACKVICSMDGGAWRAVCMSSRGAPRTAGILPFLSTPLDTQRLTGRRALPSSRLARVEVDLASVSDHIGGKKGDIGWGEGLQLPIDPLQTRIERHGNLLSPVSPWQGRNFANHRPDDG